MIDLGRKTMIKRHWLLAVLGVALLLAASAYTVLARQEARPTAQDAFTYYSYAVKFVCGIQRFSPNNPGEPPVKPGNYATEINIHNYQYNVDLVPVRKKVVLLVDRGEPIGREPRSVEPTAFDGIELKPDYATMDDCNRIAELLWGAVPTPMPLMIGYLVLISPYDLDVDVVYTAEVPAQPTATNPTLTGISIDVEHIAGKQLTINAAPDQLDEFLKQQH